MFSERRIKAAARGELKNGGSERIKRRLPDKEKKQTPGLEELHAATESQLDQASRALSRLNIKKKIGHIHDNN